MKRTGRKKKKLTKKAKLRLELQHDAARVTKYLRVLEGWISVVLRTDHFADGTPVQYECIVSPKGNVYRRAASWEKPSLLIDANIWPAEHHIRLVKITNKRHCRLVRKKAKRVIRMLGESNAVRWD